MSSHRYSAERRTMVQLLPWLRKLWYILIGGATLTVICDIVFLALRKEYEIYDNAAFAIISDVVTIFVFASFVWGRDSTKPLLAFSATSAFWKRFLRGLASCILALLWIMNRKPIVTGIGVAVVLAGEMLLCHHIGTIQRNLLLRGQSWNEKTTGAETGRSEEEGTAGEHSAKGAGRTSLESVSWDDGPAHAVEIVRPPEVNPETTMYTRFLLDTYLGQFQRQQLAHLHYTWQKEHGEVSELGEGKEVVKDVVEVKGVEEAVVQEGEGQQAGQDNPLKESSFKFEVPIDTPLEPAVTGSSSLAPARRTPTSVKLENSPSAPPLSPSTVVEDCQGMSARPLSDQAFKDSPEKDPSRDGSYVVA
ncbi:hypothetical protein BGZ68_009273 [Mortierella alpina]|nr:hypothetical protein BGZ68_009273 [Mortierella alpina]